jgi:uncharacterized membrane protein (UPF0182 family)
VEEKPPSLEEYLGNFMQGKFAEFNDKRKDSEGDGEDNKNRISPGRKRVYKICGIAIAVLAVLIIAVFAASRTVTDILWYQQIGFLRVLFTEWGLKIAIGIAVAVIMFFIVFTSGKIAFKTRPLYKNPRQNPVLGAYSGIISKYTGKILAVFAAFIGIVTGISYSGSWSDILLMFNSVPFGKTDPQFHNDISFYVFILPGLRDILGFAMSAVVLGGIVMLVVHFIFGSIVISQKGFKLLTPARVQLAVYAAIIFVILALNTFFDMYSTLTGTTDKVTGAAYTDVHAVIPGHIILSVIMLIIAVMLIITAIRGHWKLAIISIGVCILSSVILLGIYPAVVQKFWVNPNAQSAEQEYIQRNMDATSDAYGIKDLKTTQYQAKTSASPEDLQKDAEVAAQIRLLDPQVVPSTFRQLQQIKQYYNFADSLAVDKYDLNGKPRDTVIAARELSLAGSDQRNWVNDHTVYTHGFGVVAAYGSQINSDGSPSFYEKNIPTTGELTDKKVTGAVSGDDAVQNSADPETTHTGYEPRIYFSPNSPDYSIVGSSNPNDKWEFDYPTDNKDGAQTTRYTGDGGPKIDNALLKAMFAIRFGSDQVFFSSRVTDGSQVLFDRDPKERVQKIAPYLTLDGRVYPAVVDGRVKWIIDGYTTSDAYPYSEGVDLKSVTQDSMTESSNTIKGLTAGSENYIRNSVKATVDAYDGSVSLYAWDTKDPVLQAWSKIFPNTYRPISEISGDLMRHIRYPENLFKVQRYLVARYHVDTANQFFSGEDFWQLPNDPTETDKQAKQPPYYLTMQMPDQESPTFSLSSAFIPAGNNTREILTGFMTADSDAGDKAGVIGPNYGTLRLLELPKNSTVPGPGQVQNNFNSDATVSKELNLLQTGSSMVKRGNLLTLPIGGGLVYVQPVYVQSSGATSYPLLKKVLVEFGDKVGFADTLNDALQQVFGGSGSSGNNGGGNNSGGSGDVTPTPTQSPTGGTDNDKSVKAALQDAEKAISDSEEALKNGDFAAYGEAQKRLKEAIDKANELQK